jgi:hypothetical protein
MPAQAKESNIMVATTPMLEDKFRKVLKLEEEMVCQPPTQLATNVKELTQEELDTLYARDMYQLSAKARDEVLQDVHGVADAAEETPAFVQQQRRELLHEIDALIGKSSSKEKHKTAAYELAVKQDSAYATSETLQLAFLRAERFDPKATARTLVQFFEAKNKLFGPGKLTKTITISDLSKEDKKSLESGFFQILPVRDVAGRAILCGIPMLRQYKTLENLVSLMLSILYTRSMFVAPRTLSFTQSLSIYYSIILLQTRAFFYMVMTALEDEETQKLGIVLLGYNMGAKSVVDRPAVWAIQKLRKALPMRVVGMHYCYDSFKMRPMMTLAMLVMGATSRVRFRAHYGE